MRSLIEPEKLSTRIVYTPAARVSVIGSAAHVPYTVAESYRLHDIASDVGNPDGRCWRIASHFGHDVQRHRNTASIGLEDECFRGRGGAAASQEGVDLGRSIGSDGRPAAGRRVAAVPFRCHCGRETVLSYYLIGCQDSCGGRPAHAAGSWLDRFVQPRAERPREPARRRGARRFGPVGLKRASSPRAEGRILPTSNYAVGHALPFGPRFECLGYSTRDPVPQPG